MRFFNSSKLPILGIAAACLLLISAESDPVAIPVPQPLSIAPQFSRCVVKPVESRFFDLVVSSSQACTVINADTECRCVRVLNSFPINLVPGTPLTLHLQVAGILSGVKTVSVHTTIGHVTASIQVVSAGLGLGRDIFQHTLFAAQQEHASVSFILKDLHGAIRNCGCSDGSLGGVDHLAALPAWCRSIAPQVATRFIYIGDTNGMRIGVDTLLSQHGWSAAGDDIRLSDNPQDDVLQPGILAVTPTVPTAINHAKIVRIPIDEGMVIVALIIVNNRIVAQDVIPIDNSLPRDERALAAFTFPLTVHVHEDIQPSESCVSCHSSASTIWHASAHAHAYAALAVADRTNTCISCHTTPLSKTDVAAGVQCQACHQNTETHVASKGVTRTSGTVSCQSCHDERRQPDFLRDPSWAQILHGR